jgi:hypothetical protein
MVIVYRIYYFIHPSWFVLDFIMDGVVYGGGVIAALVVLIKSFKVRNYIPIMTILLGIICIVGTKIYEHHDQNKPSLIYASQMEDINGMWIDLRQDKTYLISYYSLLGGDYHNGNYRIENDTIYLNKEYPLGKGNNYMTNKLVAKDNKIYFHLDKNNNYDSTYYMTIKTRNHD